jgi:hypothetical protein
MSKEGILSIFNKIKLIKADYKLDFLIPEMS